MILYNIKSNILGHFSVPQTKTEKHDIRADRLMCSVKLSLSLVLIF